VTYTRPNGVRHLMAGYDLSTDRLYGHVVKRKGRTEFLTFVRYLRSLHPPAVLIVIVLDNFIPHPSTRAEANNVELAYTSTYSSWLNRIGPSSRNCATSLSTAPTTPSHQEQASMIRRYIIGRNRNAQDRALTELIKRPNVA
jgi:hypothetical protein